MYSTGLTQSTRGFETWLAGRDFGTRPFSCSAPAVPAVVFPLIGFAAGAALAWLSADDLARQGSAIGRPLCIVALLSILVYAPAGSYLITFFPDWSFAYFVDVVGARRALPTAACLLTAASLPLGFVSAARSAEARRASRVLRLALGPALLGLASVVVLSPRLGVYATYAQFHGDFGTGPIAGSPLGYAILWSLLADAAGLLWTARVLVQLSSAASRD